MVGLLRPLGNLFSLWFLKVYLWNVYVTRQLYINNSNDALFCVKPWDTFKESYLIKQHVLDTTAGKQLS